MTPCETKAGISKRCDFHSAANADAIVLKEHLTSKLEEGMAALAIALDETTKQIYQPPAAAPSHLPHNPAP